MKRLKQYFDTDTPEQAALQNLVLTLLTEVKQRHIDWFADVCTEHMSFERWIENNPVPTPGSNSLRDYNLQKQSRITLITNFTTCIHMPVIHQALIESIRWDLCYGGVDDVLERTPFLFREENKAFHDKHAKRAEEAGMPWQ